MERLTERHVNRKGAYMACSSNCHSGPCEYCTELEKIIDRLAAYEDTGLEPAEYKKQVDAIKKLDIEHMHDLLQAEKDGRLVAYMPGNKVYDRFGTPWIVKSTEIHLIGAEIKHLYRCGHPGTEDYYAMYEEEIREAEATMKKREVENETD